MHEKDISVAVLGDTERLARAHRNNPNRNTGLFTKVRSQKVVETRIVGRRRGCNHDETFTAMRRPWHKDLAGKDCNQEQEDFYCGVHSSVGVIRSFCVWSVFS